MKRTKRAFVASVSGYVLISVFASIIGVPKVIASSAVGLRICAVTAAVKKYQPIVREKRNTHNKIVLLVKTKLNTMKALISKTTVDSCINHYDFVLLNTVLSEYNEMSEEIKNPENAVEYVIET